MKFRGSAQKFPGELTRVSQRYAEVLLMECIHLMNGLSFIWRPGFVQLGPRWILELKGGIEKAAWNDLVTFEYWFGFGTQQECTQLQPWSRHV